ncbi:type II CRISPR RNA-guided endonuclease Cas9 [Mesorhizobium sp. A556]
MGTRYSFDIGTNSIGWAVWRTGVDPKGIFGPDAPLELLGAGVRLFKDGRNPKDKESLAVMRRIPRQARKRRDRFVLRREALTAALVEIALMPVDATQRKALAELDPYRLRAAGLDAKLAPHEFGRALFHLHQRRGFKSNRKTDRKGDDKDQGKIAAASAALAKKLEDENARTFGEFLWHRHRDPELKRQAVLKAHDPAKGKPDLRTASLRRPTRIRLDGQGATALYEFYPTREMLRHEFDALWQAQARHHPALLTQEAKEKIETILFRQRELKPPKIGLCTFEYAAGEHRLPKALPSVQAREIYERLGHIRLSTGEGTERPLKPSERDDLATALLYSGLTRIKVGKTTGLTFTEMRKALRLGGEVRINFEEMGEKGLADLRTNRLLTQDDHYSPRWRALAWAEKDAFVQKLIEATDDDKLVAQLVSEDGLSEQQARNAASIPLPDGYSRLGPTANAGILEALIEERDENGFVVTYDKAVRRAGEKLGKDWHHSDERDGELFDALPYYGKVLQRHILPGTMEPADRKDDAKFYGRIMNPSVHISLNQLRRLVNALIERFSPPDQIVVELARDLKMSAREKEQEQRRNRENRDANDKRAKKLGELGQDNNGENRAKLKLHEEQERASGGVALCPFTLKPIAVNQLFSPEIEIEHILPRSRTLDDSAANKVLCFRTVNRLKRGRTPCEAFHDKLEWADIAANAEKLPPNKRWRFRQDAMEQFEARASGKIDKKTLDDMGLNNGFQARHLNETKHMSRLAKAYLGKICNPDHIYVTPGALTGLLRGKWGLNSILSDDNRKDRTDHRHHAIDAITIGAMTRRLLLELNTLAGRAEQSQYDDVVGKVPWPFDNFRDAVRTVVERIVISNKPEHGKQGALHEDTAYGIVADKAEAAQIGNLVRRKPLADLTPGEVDRIRDAALREAVQAAVEPFRDAKGKVADAKGFATALSAFADDHKIRRIRVGKDDVSAVAIHDRRTGVPYKAVAPGENHHVDVVSLRDGSWKGFAATVFEVNAKDFRPQWEREKIGGKLVMRLHKGDAVELESAGVRIVKYVQQIWMKSNLVLLTEHYEGGDLQKRHQDADDPFRWDFANIGKLKERGCVAVKVDEIGRVITRIANV